MPEHAPRIRPVAAVGAMGRRLAAGLTRFGGDETTLMLVAAVAIGAAVGLVVTAFYALIDLIHNLVLNGASRIEVADTLLIPLVVGAGLVAARVLVRRGTRDSDGENVADVMYRVTLRNGQLRSAPVLVKTLAAAAVIGTGGSVGAEGPVIVAGAATASRLGRWMSASPNRQRTLVGCGAAAGLAAAFNAPIAGVLFSIEKILGTTGGLALGPFVVATIVATAVSRAVFGNRPMLSLPAAFEVHAPAELLLYAAIGLLVGGVGVLYTRGVWKVNDVLRRLPLARQLLAASLVVGVLDVLLRADLWGRGHEVLDLRMIEGRGALFLLALAAAKLLATALSLGAARTGGVFAPALFIGATVGGAAGVASQALPALRVEPGAAALVGMAGLVAGATHAPLTAVMMVFEMTGDYGLILPLLLTSVVAYGLARRLHNESIYTEWLTRRGVHLVHGADAAVLARIAVADCLTPEPRVLSPGAPLEAIRRNAGESRQTEFPVVDSDGRLYGMLTQAGIREALGAGEHLSDLVVAADLVRPDSARVTADDSVLTALRRLGAGDLDALPVVDHHGGGRLVGMVTRRDLMAAYERALTAEPH